MLELWFNAGGPKLEQERSRSIIHPFVIKSFNGLTINPYKGCSHRCAYCYATYEWSPEFYNKIYGKTNAAEVLDKQLADWKSDTVEPVMISSATDAYQPAELRFELTRKCVKVLQKYQVPYYVFTKSAIIERDLELHRKYKHNCFVVWSITTCNEKIRRIVEPGTPPAKRIFEVIDKFIDAEVPCGVNIDPIMPLITDSESDLEEVVGTCKDSGLSHVFGSPMRLRTDIWQRIKIVLRMLQIPDGVERYKDMYGFEEPLDMNYVTLKSQYAKRIKDSLDRIIKTHGMTTQFPEHMRARRIDKSCLGQTSLYRYIDTYSNLK